MADGSKEIPLKCRPRPSLLVHAPDLHQNAKHSSREKTKSSGKKRGGRERGKGKEREARQSPGWLFLALLIVWDFSPVPSASPYPCYLHTSSTVLQELYPEVSRPEANVKENWTSRREGWRSSAGMKGRNDVLKAEATPAQAEQQHLYENII